MKRRAVPCLRTGMIVGVSTARREQIRVFGVRHFLGRPVIDDTEKSSASRELALVQELGPRMVG